MAIQPIPQDGADFFAHHIFNTRPAAIDLRTALRTHGAQQGTDGGGSSWAAAGAIRPDASSIPIRGAEAARVGGVTSMSEVNSTGSGPERTTGGGAIGGVGEFGG